jgi:hypothetical protein
MTVSLLQPTSREAERLYTQREELVERIGRAIGADGTIQPLPGLHLTRISVPFKPIHRVLKPSVCMIAQGSKEVILGEYRYQYDPAHFLLVTLELPRVGPDSSRPDHSTTSRGTGDRNGARHTRLLPKLLPTGLRGNGSIKLTANHGALGDVLIKEGVSAAIAAATGSRPGRAVMIRTMASSSPALRRANAAGAGPAGP